ncbi:TPA: hypothetical protein I3806_004618 [Enterobacter cloacae]|nr:hypothetical protein [Enterobacter cloacae]
MPKRLKESSRYVECYSRLIAEFEQVSMLLRQLGAGEYHEFSVYMNNLKHLEKRQLAIQEILNGDGGFLIWLKNEDPELWCNIMATGLTFRMLDNLIVNLRNTLTREYCRKT